MKPANVEPFETATCGMCAAPLYVLGVLGNLIHFYCRACGAQYSGRDVSETRAAVARAAKRSAEIDKGEL